MSASPAPQSPQRPASAESAHSVPGWLVGLLAVASGMTVANLYYAQPLLSSLSQVFHLDTATAGLLITVTQIGFVVGMLFLVPLGDRLEKRRLVTVLLAVATVALAVAGFATSFPMLFAASLVSGATSVVAQILVPYAASLAPDHARGRIVGRVMSGLLAGILLSRTVSSLVSDVAGWRYVYFGSAVLMALLALALRVALPQQAPTTSLAYGQVLRSTFRLVRTHPALLRRGLYQAAMYAAFSAFWTTVSFVLTGPRFHYSPIGVGVFALVGAAGAAVAPLAGRWADRELARPVTGIAFVVAALAFAVAGFGQRQIILIALAGILIDVAVQTTLILGQHTIYRLDAGARSRLNSAFMAVFFAGGALGSQLGSLAYHAAGWTGVSVLGAALPLIALAYWVTGRRSGRKDTEATTAAASIR
ncbi:MULTISPECIES: MFS transporter [unclassified Streptomyces]|uniref:MFS transporter n=1 Tax=unclassified Streptomyces TaxID=2593676 RepID=UPI002DDAEA18|nr:MULTISPECIES: MFS transporter [unclassified Streptomyces]WSF81906.1 MFS transporter [Streptomyces sp. NBC_01744]WSC34277.1 MFS transporter [Streptomyces sp. NBC_01763]WSC41784.1 MFS transporter [Streptomyces sp. NBC_01763]WSC51072.1 MFS transporter [Streptomyces sp. NBC_01761]WSC58450.1 MFS transporter [Streptomyces sp. NBC_01761]